jgi:hypothetical protein
VQPWTAMVARHRSEHRPELGRGEAARSIGFAGRQGNVYLYVGGSEWLSARPFVPTSNSTVATTVSPTS